MTVPSRGLTIDSWKSILRPAAALLDELKSRQLEIPDLTMGGGTVLMFRFDHRISKDIDFFFHDAQWLTFLTPRLNDFASGISSDYVEQSNSIKIVMAQGDIDFIAAPTIIANRSLDPMVFMGREFQLDATAEILAKKLLYRADVLKPRDVFDLAACILFDPESAAVAASAAAPKKRGLLRRIDDLGSASSDFLEKDIVTTARSAMVFQTMLSSVYRLIEQASDGIGT